MERYQLLPTARLSSASFALPLASSAPILHTHTKSWYSSSFTEIYMNRLTGLVSCSGDEKVEVAMFAKFAARKNRHKLTCSRFSVTSEKREELASGRSETS